MLHLRVTSLFVVLYVTSRINSETEDGSPGKRLVLDGEFDVYTEVRVLKAEVQTLTAQLETQKLKLNSFTYNSGAASTYIRWGKTTCANDTDFVYEGYLSGKKYDDHGSGSDTQCLPVHPTWNKYDAQANSFRAKMYGGELDAWAGTHIFEKDVLNEDMACAVCRPSFPTTMMFPARSDCFPGWTLQYSGYLVTNSDGANRGTYAAICLDKDPDFVPHSQADDNQHVVYLTEVKCGSLPCPPYIDNAELACSVCSK